MTRLASDGDPGLRIESYLRFDVTGVLGTVQRATLKLYVAGDGTVDGPAVSPTSTDWDEAAVTWETRPRSTGAAVADIGAVSPGTWIELDVTAAVHGNGAVALQLRQTGLDGVQFYSRQGSYRPQLTVTWTDDPVVMAAGDIACVPGASVTATACRHRYTSDLLGAEPALAAVLALGDLQYEDGLASEFVGAGAYHDTWGRYKAVTRPVPGNHEYHVAGAPGYFDYFGSAAGTPGRGYYSFDVGSWHLVALNSEIETTTGSAQERWLRADLAATASDCILAYWHRPRFGSGSHGSDADFTALWRALYDAKADVVLNGHDHDYERFAPQDPDGGADAEGLREFVVGTGGASHEPFGSTIAPNSEFRDGTAFGVLKLTLHGSSYDWAFVPESGPSKDAGSTACHDSPGAVLRVSPLSGPAPLGVLADASRPADAGDTATSYTFDFGDGSPLVGPQMQPVAQHVYTADGTYTVTVSVKDGAGRTATGTDRVVVKSNLVRNPGFEVDLSGWNGGSQAGVAVTRVAGGHSGEWAAAVVNGGTGPVSCVLNDSPDTVRPTGAGSYTASLWVRGEAAGATLKLRLREWNGAVLAGTTQTQVVLDGSWQQVSVAYTPVAPGSSTLDFNAYISGAPPGTCFRADDASVVFTPREAPPAAALAVSPSVGAVPVSVTADASRSTDIDSTPIAAYTFDFGDGTPPVGPQPGPIATHTYTADGVYTVTVTVVDTAGLSGTASASVRVKPNLVLNPGFEVDLSGWNGGSQPGVALKRVAGGHSGEWAAAVGNGGTGPVSCLLNDSPDTVRPSVAGLYTGSLWVRGEAAGATLKLRFREWAGGALAGSASTQVVLGGSWQQISVSYTPVAPGSSTLDFNAYVSNAPPGTCFYADDVLIVRD